MLVESTDEHILLDTDSGRVTVPRSAVVATRIIPPRPVRRGSPHRALSIPDLERVMVEAWPPVERARLGDWVLRFGHGFTQRANSALVLGHPDRPVAPALEAVTSWYASRGLPARLTIPLATGARLDADEVARSALRLGWAAMDPVLVLTAAVRTVLASTQDPSSVTRAARAGTVEVTDRMTEEWFGLLSTSRPSPRAAAEAVLHGSARQRFALARRGDGEAVGIGRLGVGAGWGGLGAMWVRPGHRRQGVARSLLHTLAEEAASSGCVSMHLQVEQSSPPALALYEAAGFSPHHRYVNVTASDA